MASELVDVPNPCAHGNDLRVLQVPPGSTVWSPTCADGNHNMRAHVIGEAPAKKPK